MKCEGEGGLGGGIEGAGGRAFVGLIPTRQPELLFVTNKLKQGSYDKDGAVPRLW